MGDPQRSAKCAECGRELPTTDGIGRRRLYCNATCRSAARRRRQRYQPAPVNNTLPPSICHDSIDASWDSSDLARLLAEASQAMTAMAHMPTDPQPDADLNLVARAKELTVVIQAILQRSVDQARAVGATWEQVGGVLRISRQAAFQRFGHPAPVQPAGTPGNVPLPDAAERVARIIALLIDRQWEQVHEELSDEMSTRVDVPQLAMGWEHTVAMIGQIERVGDPFAQAIRGHTVVDTALYFEAGERLCRIVLDSSGVVVGLFLRPLPG